jgi:uncharacterized protein YunC (DUF1805 family)
MIETDRLSIDGKTVLGVRVDLPDSPPLVAIVGDKGFVMCGFLNVDVAEKLGVAAAMVSGVKTFNDVLRAEVRAATSSAKAKGVELGMKAQDALKLLV